MPLRAAIAVVDHDESEVKRKRWPWIVTALIVVIALGSGAYAAAGDDDDPVTAAASAGAEAVRLNRAGTDGAFTVAVTGLRCGVATVGPAELPQRAKGEFCLVDVAVKNAGKGSRLLDGSEQRAVDANERAYAVDDRAAAFLNDSLPSLLDEIPANSTVRGVLPFDVPAGTRLSALLVHESSDTHGARISLTRVTDTPGR